MTRLKPLHRVFGMSYSFLLWHCATIASRKPSQTVCLMVFFVVSLTTYCATIASRQTPQAIQYILKKKKKKLYMAYTLQILVWHYGIAHWVSCPHGHTSLPTLTLYIFCLCHFVHIITSTGLYLEITVNTWKMTFRQEISSCENGVYSEAHQAFTCFVCLPVLSEITYVFLVWVSDNG